MAALKAAEKVLEAANMSLSAANVELLMVQDEIDSAHDRASKWLETMDMVVSLET
eukprot:SAG11_NODE_602_length_8251_cov_6.063543_1_plen_55_part_00